MYQHKSLAGLPEWKAFSLPAIALAKVGLAETTIKN